MVVMVHGKASMHSFKCPEEFVFDNDLLTCIPPKVDARLPSPLKCSAENQLLADPENCASFYQCSHDVAYRKCCPANLAWNAEKQICDYVAGCTKKPECPVYVEPTTAEPTTLGPEPETCVNGIYIFAKVEGKPGSFKQTIEKTGVFEGILTCPQDHVFSTRHCGCYNPDLVIPPPSKNCCKRLDFDSALSTNQLWVGETETGVEIKNKQVCFAAGGFLNIPYYNNVPFKNNLELTFKYELTTATDNAILIANAETMEAASFCVYLEKETIKVKITTEDKETFTVEKKAVAGVVSVKYDGTNLSLIVAEEETKTKAKGFIKRIERDLFIGGGLIGCIDDFDFCIRGPIKVEPQSAEA